MLALSVGTQSVDEIAVPKPVGKIQFRQDEKCESSASLSTSTAKIGGAKQRPCGKGFWKERYQCISAFWPVPAGGCHSFVGFWPVLAYARPQRTFGLSASAVGPSCD